MKKQMNIKLRLTSVELNPLACIARMQDDYGRVSEFDVFAHRKDFIELIQQPEVYFNVTFNLKEDDK